MLLSEKLKNYQLILGSASPRRQQFLKDLGLDFKIQTKAVKEEYPAALASEDLALFLAQLKASAYQNELKPNDLLLTGDTVVYDEYSVLHKPKDEEEAVAMLQRLSGKSHRVCSAVCLSSTEKKVLVKDTTKVYFKELKKSEIEFYVDQFQPFDKAGGYGIQEWIGKIGIDKIEGSFYTVMGMPTAKVYSALWAF